MSIPTDIQHLMIEAWEKVLPRLRNDPDELARRLARRRTAVLAKPWRPYCLAIRANDHRITPYRAIFTPEHAIELDDPRHPYEYLEHSVTVDSALVRHVCRPYHTLPPGEPAFEVARKLGCGYATVGRAMKEGFFHVNPKPGLRGRRGNPVPVIYSERWLDPNSDVRLQMPDAIWGTHDTFLSDRVPDGIEQTLVRRPMYHALRKRHRQFVGWRWVCPSCAASAKVIYRPLPSPMLNLQEDLGWVCDCDDREGGLQCFACERCHGIQRTTRVNQRLMWGILIALFSGGLLYGHEVDRPPDYARGVRRKATFRRRRRLCRSPRHREVVRLLVETDWPLRRIALELMIDHVTVHYHAKRAYRDHAVSGREELREALAKREVKQNVA
jgi:hypothetical protein